MVNKKELALFLGMLAGDGCLSIKHNGDGDRVYPINFYNTNKDYVKGFSILFVNLFDIKGSIRCRKRKNKQDLWEFEKYSKKIFTKINEEFEIPCGKKAPIVQVPSFILSGDIEEKKNFFLGVLITDGGIKKNRSIMFHSASKELIKGIITLIFDLWGIKRTMKEYLQRQRFLSYQITLNIKDSSIVLNDLAEVAQSGTAQIMTPILEHKRKP
jgi:intein/homing endonuclease